MCANISRTTVYTLTSNISGGLMVAASLAPDRFITSFPNKIKKRKKAAAKRLTSESPKATNRSGSHRRVQCADYRGRARYDHFSCPMCFADNTMSRTSSPVATCTAESPESNNVERQL